MVATQALKRVERLEAATGGGGGFPPCPECGWGGGDDFGPNDTYEVVFVDPDEDTGPEFCESCGGRVAYDIYFPERLPHGR